MKIILTGATGFIGAEILTQLLASPTITSIISISRRRPPQTHAKLKPIILKDFTAWPPSVLEECAGAQACIWALGLASNDLEKNRVINYDYTLAGCRALFGMPGMGQRMRFLYLSGFLAERDQGRGLWVGGPVRKLRGELENQLLELGKQHADVGATYIVRPAFALRKDMGSLTHAVVSAGGMLPSLVVDQLAAAMIRIVVEGGEVQIWENQDLIRIGSEALLKGV